MGTRCRRVGVDTLNTLPFSRLFNPSPVQENTRQVESLSTENTLWADTVVASGTVTGVVVSG